jgi:7-keto-8-aminopelargonate synthetase-like enzyme
MSGSIEQLRQGLAHSRATGSCAIGAPSIRRRTRTRRSTAGGVLNFSSNDYLGLAADPRLAAAAHAAIDAFGTGRQRVAAW